MKKLITLAVILFLTINLQGQENEKTFAKDNYSIKYPSTWIINTSGLEGTLFAITSPLSSSQDNYLENVNLIIQDLKGKGIDLSKYTSISKQQISQVLPNAKILEDKRVKKDGYEYHTIVVTAFMSEKDLKFKQLYTIKDEKAYVLTFTSMESEYDNFIDEANKILNSFKLN